MGTNTPRLNLFKPSPSDLVDVTTDISANYDLIDSGVALDAHAHSGTYVAYAPAPTGVAATDRAAINTALAAATAGSIVQLQAGTYKTDSQLVIPPFVALEGTHGNRTDNIQTTTVVQPAAGFTDTAVIRLLDKEEGSYATENEGVRIRRLTLDCQLTSGTIDGIRATGYVHGVILDNVCVQKAPRRAISCETYTRVSTVVYHPYSWNVWNCLAWQCASHGFYFGNQQTDCTFVNDEALGCTGDGFVFTAAQNSQATSCRAEFCDNGFHLTGSWGTGTGSGGMELSGCSTDRNTKNGMLIDSTGNATHLINGLMTRRDGRNGNSGGGGYAGLNIASATTPVIVNGVSCYPGVDDDGSGTNSPQYGATFSGNTWVVVTSGYLHGNTAGWFDGGTNTVLRRGLNVGTASGSTASPTRDSSNPWNTNGAGTIALATADQAALTITNTQANSGLPLIDYLTPNVTDRAISSRITGDANRRFNLQIDGKQEWGGGSGSRDVNLYRSAAGVLKTDNTLNIATPGTAAGSAATIDGTQTLTGKTIDGGSNTLTSIAESSVTNLTTDLAAKQAITKTGIAKTSGGTQQWGIPGMAFTGAGTTTLVINTDRYVPIFVPYAVTLTAWEFEVTTTPASAANVKLGIYPADTDMQPKAATAPLYDSGSVAVANGFTGIKTATGLSVALTPGVYLVGINCDVAMGLRTWTGPTPIISAALGASPLVQSVTVGRAFAAFPTPGTKWTAVTAVANGLQHFLAWQWTE